MKGFDPLVASVLLVVIAVSIAAVVTNWQSWFLPYYTDQLTSQSRTQLECSRAGLSLENVTFNCRNNCLPGVQHTLNATVRNIGDISLPLFKLYLETASGSVTEFPLTTTLALDQALAYTNNTNTDCRSFNRSVSRVIVVTACSSMPSAFSGDVINWVNC